MLRALVAVLILANLGFLAWSQGWLDALALGDSGAASQREPERLKRQIHPERLILVPAPGAPAVDETNAPDGAASGAAPASSVQGPGAMPGTTPMEGVTTVSAAPDAGAACYQAGPLTAEEHRRVSAALAQQLDSNGWTTQTVTAPGLWLIYMGPYPEPEVLERKQAELRRFRNLNFEEVRSPPSLAGGLSLGRFNQEAQAQSTLENLRQRGVRSARVVTLRPAADLKVIRVPQASTEVQRQLTSLGLPAGKGFAACAT